MIGEPEAGFRRRPPEKQKAKLETLKRGKPAFVPLPSRHSDLAILRQV
jgi:hypothetical protein